MQSSSLDSECAVNKLLDLARNGDTDGIKDLLDKQVVDINAKGSQKKNYGWTALHLSAYFGHEDVISALLNHGADVNAINATGDSALHKAALSNRLNVVRHLISHGADVNLVNAEGFSAKQLTDMSDIVYALEAAVKSDLLKLERKLLDAAREGDVETVFHLLQHSPPSATPTLSDLSNGNSTYQQKTVPAPSVNCVDALGNRPLHYAALAGNRETVIILLQLGADPQLTNKRGLRPVDLARDLLIKELLDVKSLKDMSKSAKKTEGVLLRKSRIRGYREHWVVLENGTLSLQMNRESERGKKREKGGRFLAGSKIEGESGKDAFTLRFSNKSKLMFSVPKGENAAFERQKWINSFRDHIDHANKLLDFELKVVDDDEAEQVATSGSLQLSVENIRAYDQLIRRQVEDINKVQIQLRQEQRTVSGLPSKLQDLVQDFDGKVSHLVGLSNQMCSDLTSCVNIMSQREELYRKEIDEERRRNKILEESLHQVAKEAKHLETSLQTIRSNSFQAGSVEQFGSSRVLQKEGDSEDSDDEITFFDCPSPEAQAGLPLSPDTVVYNRDETIVAPNGIKSELKEAIQIETRPKTNSKSHRKVLPVTMYSRKVSVWTILKQCIGKDLSRITMPIVLNEPMTFLQKQAEYFEYSELLHRATQTENAVDRMELVAAFVVSTISSSVERIAKPFNPLLGETYELEKPDYGFRIVNEQVSHHPPVSAFYAESIGRSDGGFKVTGSMCPKIRFWGKSIEIQPKGVNTLELAPFKEVYTWESVKVVCHNIIIGRIWLEYQGRCELVNHTNGLRCVIDFKPAGWFGELHRIEGTIYNEKNEKLRCIYGKWTEAVYSVPVEVWTAHERGASSGSRNSVVNGRGGAPDSDTDGATGGSVEELEIGAGATSSPCDLHLDGQKLLWSAIPIPDYCRDYFNFSPFAMQLNEPPTPELRAILPRTDSRLRPDLRLLEEGDIDRAAAEKHRIEEKQRLVRRKMQEKKQEWTPLWFRLATNPYTRSSEWSYTGEYFRRDFTKCPDIFEL